MTRRVTRCRSHSVMRTFTRSSSCTSSKTSCAKNGNVVLSDVPTGDPERRQGRSTATLGGSHTPRPILNHGGSAEHHLEMSQKGYVAHQELTRVKSRPYLLHRYVAQLQSERP